jgi:hypothetical protein
MFGKIAFSSSSQTNPKPNRIFKNKDLEHLTVSNLNRDDKSNHKVLEKYKSKKIKKDKLK